MIARICLLGVILLSFLVAMPVGAETPSWTCNGPYGGHIQALGVSPAFGEDRTLYAGSPTGELFVTTDAGETWRPALGYDKSPVSSVAISPDFASDETLYVSTTTKGVLRSADRGETWVSWSDGLTSLSATVVVLSPSFDSDQTALVATQDGVFRTTNGGKLWSPVGPSARTLSLAVGSAGSGIEGKFVAFAGTVNGMQRSVDGGETWLPVGLAGLPVTAVAVSPYYAIDGAVVAGTVAGVYYSQTGGAAWADPQLAGQTLHSLLFSPGYASDGRLYAGTENGLFMSVDRGVSWGLSQWPHSSVHTLAVAGDRLYAGSEPEGILTSVSRGDSWDAKNHGLTDRAMRAVAVSPGFTHDVRVYAGGPSGMWRSQDDGRTWTLTELDYAEVSAIQCSASYIDNNTVYAGTNGGVFVSNDGGQSWRPTLGALPVLDVNDLTLDEGDQLWVGTDGGGVYFSPNAGDTWMVRSNGLGSLQITSVEWLESASGGDHLLAGTWGSGIYRSLDGGLSWHPADESPDTPHILSLVSGRGFDGRLWSFSGTTAGVFRSGDSGVGWDYVGLIGLRVPALAMHPAYADRPNCYAGTPQDGVTHSTNGGLTWQPINTGLGDMRIQGLDVGLDSQAQPVLYAASQSGVWRNGGSPRDPQPHPSERLLILPLVLRMSVAGTTGS